MSPAPNKPEFKSLTISAPAKINLFLHITGVRLNGYHNLESLVCFADISDSLKIEPADYFSFHIDGPFAQHLPHDETKNLVLMALRLYEKAYNVSCAHKITLTKNLPIAAGIGGGTSDAAALIFLLSKIHNTAINEAFTVLCLQQLGADMPVCMACAPTFVRGIGEILTPAPPLPEMPVLLINPMKACPTPKIFAHYDGHYKQKITIQQTLSSPLNLLNFLQKTSNDLLNPALKIVPEIRNILNSLNHAKGCDFAQLSGSGATCFGIFASFEAAEVAKNIILAENPDWWGACGWLNRIERY